MSQYKLILACSICKLTHFNSIFDLQKHWDNSEECNLIFANLSFPINLIQIETKVNKNEIIEYLNFYNCEFDTYYSYYDNNQRHLYYKNTNCTL